MNEPPEWEPMWYEPDVRRAVCVLVGAAGGIALGGYAGYAITAANPYNSLDAVGGSVFLGGLLGVIIGSLAGLIAGGARPASWERWQRRQKVAAACGIVVAMVAAAVLGGFGLARIGHGSKASEIRINDQANVAYAEECLWSAVQSRSDSIDLFRDTQAIVSALRRARSHGVARAWIEREISDAESDLSHAPGGCDRCRTILEGAR